MDNIQDKITFFSLKMKEKNINIESTFWFERYIKFSILFQIKLDNFNKKTHKHHILPVSIFPEYKNFKENKWNLSLLSIRAHIISHYMLAKAIGGKMWAPLFFYKKKYNFNSKIIEEIYIQNSIRNSTSFKETVVIYDEENEKCRRISKEDFIKGNFKTFNEGNKSISKMISNSLNKVQENGKTLAQNKAKVGKENPMFGRIGDLNPFYGKKHTDETISILSEMAKNRIMSDETKIKIKQSCSKPKKCKDNYSKYIYVIYMDDIEIFSSHDQRDLKSFLLKKKYPSLYRLKKGDILNFKFRKLPKPNLG